MKSYSMWKIASFRQRHRAFLMVVLAILAMLISSFASLVRLLPDNNYLTQFQIDRPSSESVDPKVLDASDLLVNDLRQASERLTQEVQQQVARSAKKAIHQYRNHLPQGYQVPKGLRNSIESTLTQNISKSLDQNFKNTNTLTHDYALEKREYFKF